MKLLSKPQRRWHRWRRATQIAVALFYVGLPLLHLAGIRAVSGNLAALEVGPVDFIEPAAGLSVLLAGTPVVTIVLLGMLPVVLLAVLLGPVFCSWICPWGLLSEWIDRLLRRGRRRRWPGDGWRRLTWPRVLVFAALVAAGFWLGTPLVAFLSAPRLITTLPIEVFYLRIVSPVSGLLLLALLALELLAPRRLWCRALCPVGTAAKLLRTPQTLAIRFDAESCLCPAHAKCQTACAWGIDPRSMTMFDGCTNCLACIDSCPAGSLAFGRPQLATARRDHYER